MRTITRSDFNSWCGQRGLKVADREWPSYASGLSLSLTLKLPESPYKAIALARACFQADDNAPFEGAMIWYREWGIWNKEDEETFSQTVLRLRAAMGEHRPLIDAPGHILTSEEYVDARALWAQPVLIGWDAILFPEKRDYFAFNSHDEVISIISGTEDAHSRLIEEFKEWKPSEDGWYFR